MANDLAAIEKRLDAGEWLRPGEVAALLGVSRSTVNNKLNTGEIGHRLKGGGPQRLCDPADVRRLLDESRRDRRGAH